MSIKKNEDLKSISFGFGLETQIHQVLHHPFKRGLQNKEKMLIRMKSERLKKTIQNFPKKRKIFPILRRLENM